MAFLFLSGCEPDVPGASGFDAGTGRDSNSEPHGMDGQAEDGFAAIAVEDDAIITR